MTMKERKERIEELEERIFMLNMIDLSTYEERMMIEKCEKELRELKKMA